MTHSGRSKKFLLGVLAVYLSPLYHSIHLSNKYLLMACYMLETVLHIGDRTVNKTSKVLIFKESISQRVGKRKKQVTK